MIFDELQSHLGPYAAEIVRQALTLEEFKTLEIEELKAYFELRAAKVYQEYRSRVDTPPEGGKTQEEREGYLNVLRRRWQQAEELAHLIATAESSVHEDIAALGA